jgi:hypothetical protein
LPAAQTVPAFAPWLVPLAPQNWLVVRGSTQAPPQFTWPPWQDTAHVPALQTWPAAQAVPAAVP